MRTILVPLLGLLAACAGGPEQEARTDYTRIAEQANSVLFGEPLGYLGATGALDRNSVLCQGKTCISTATSPSVRAASALTMWISNCCPNWVGCAR